MANFGVFGTGVVGQTIGSKLLELGHHVRLGSRDAANTDAAAWVKAAEEADADGRASQGTFSDAAAFGDVLINATSGDGTPHAVDAAGAANLAGKVLIDVSNPLDFSAGFPPSLSVPSTDSLAARLQRAYPDVKVVKALGTVTASVMVDPARVPGAHSLLIAGDDDEAKAAVRDLLASFGWPAGRIIDLGGIAGARAIEAYILVWVYLYSALGTADFNIEVHRS
jgi:predicted dinucleotide-binding enzyme